jgi:hypothetical protein
MLPVQKELAGQMEAFKRSEWNRPSWASPAAHYQQPLSIFFERQWRYTARKRRWIPAPMPQPGGGGFDLIERDYTTNMRGSRIMPPILVSRLTLRVVASRQAENPACPF